MLKQSAAYSPDGMSEQDKLRNTANSRAGDKPSLDKEAGYGLLASGSSPHRVPEVIAAEVQPKWRANYVVT